MSMLAWNDGPAAAELLDSPAANRLTELTSLMVEAAPLLGRPGRAAAGTIRSLKQQELVERRNDKLPSSDNAT
jgi:hypothetical protein